MRRDRRRYKNVLGESGPRHLFPNLDGGPNATGAPPVTFPGGMGDTGELVARARRGETTAFETLVRRHYRGAYAVALALTGNGMDAEDVVQDAFVRALEKLDDCREPSRFSGWLLQIVRNRAHNVRDYQRLREGTPLDEISATGAERSDREAEQRELRDRLERALATLTDAQREIVLLHDLEGWKHREIAAQLGISEVMSRQHLFVARKALRERLGADAPEEHVK